MAVCKGRDFNNRSASTIFMRTHWGDSWRKSLLPDSSGEATFAALTCFSSDVTPGFSESCGLVAGCDAPVTIRGRISAVSAEF